MDSQNLSIEKPQTKRSWFRSEHSSVLCIVAYLTKFLVTLLNGSFHREGDNHDHRSNGQLLLRGFNVGMCVVGQFWVYRLFPSTSGIDTYSTILRTKLCLKYIFFVSFCILNLLYTLTKTYSNPTPLRLNTCCRFLLFIYSSTLPKDVTPIP